MTTSPTSVKATSLFGITIQVTREKMGRSVNDAELAGMESSEWAAVEAGYISADPGRLRAMAASLEIRYDQMATMVFLYQGAWKE